MSGLIRLGLVLLAAVGLGLGMMHSPGYVLLAFGNWSMEMSLWFALLLVGVVLLIGRLAWRILGLGVALPVLVQRRWQTRRQCQRVVQTERGLRAYWLGDWQQAEQALLAGAKTQQHALLNFIQAAWAAHARADFNKRDAILQAAIAVAAVQDDLLLRLNWARMQVEARQWTAALDTLEPVRTQAPTQPLGLYLAVLAYEGLENHEALIALLPRLRRSGQWGADALDELALYSYRGYFAALVRQKSIGDVQRYWQRLPRNVRFDTVLLLTYVEYLAETAPLQAYRLLAKAIHKRWEAAWVSAYGQLQTEETEQQYRLAKAWLKQHADQPELLLCLGKLAARLKFWARAEDYYLQALRRVPSAAVHRGLAELYVAQDRHREALNHYRQMAQFLANTALS